MSFLESFKINGTEFVAQKATDLLMPKENDGDPDVSVAEAVAAAKEIYIYETTEEGLAPDASGIAYEKTVPAGVRTEMLEKIRAGFVVYLKLVDSSNQHGRLFLLYEMDSNQLEGQNLNVVFSSNSIGYTHVYVGGDNNNNTIIRFREGNIGGSGWGIAKTGIIDVPLNNQMWSTAVPVDITDLGFTSTSDYMVFSEPTTGGTTSRWGDAIAYTNSFTATEFTVGVYCPAEMTGITKVKYIIFAKGYGTAAGGDSNNAVDKAYVDAADTQLQKQKVTGYFERTDYPITLDTVGQPSYALAKDLFTIEIENHKPYTYEFTASDVYALTQYDATIGKIFTAMNEDNETIWVTMKGALPDNVQYTTGSTNPVVDLTNATITLTKTTFLQQIDDMLIPSTSGEVFIFDVDGEQFTEDPENPGGKHFGTTINSPTFDEIMDNLVSGKIVFARVFSNNGNSYEFYQLHRGSQYDIRGKTFDLEFPQRYIWFYDIYIKKRGLGTNTTTYFGMFADKVVDNSTAGDVPTIDQVLNKGYATTKSIDFSEENGNDTNSINSRGLSLSGVATEGLRQVQYSQHGINAVDNLVGTMTDIFSVDFDNRTVAMSDDIKNAFLAALGLDGLTKMNITTVDSNNISHTYEVFGRELPTS